MNKKIGIKELRRYASDKRAKHVHAIEVIQKIPALLKAVSLIKKVSVDCRSKFTLF